VAPTGEVHLGPGWSRRPFADHQDYLRSASHNPATIFHEYGHHVCRHTADFRLNGERRPEKQRNGKIGIEEGVCDYLAASLLGTGRPYGWYRPARGSRRDPAAWTAQVDPTPGDAHQEGTPWAAVWWRCRQRLLREELIGSGVDHDRILVATLLVLGQTAGRSGSRERRRDRQAQRAAPATVVESYLGVLRTERGPRAVRSAGDVLAGAGLLESRARARGQAC
jgi:hypothetical protein